MIDWWLAALRGLPMVEAKQAAESFATVDRPALVDGDRGFDEAVSEALVIPFRAMVMRDVLVEDAMRLTLTERDHAIEALAAQGADESVREGIQVWTGGRRTTLVPALSRSS